MPLPTFLPVSESMPLWRSFVSFIADMITLKRLDCRPTMSCANLPFWKSNFTPSCLPRASATSGSMPTALPLCMNSTGGYAMSEPSLTTPALRMSAGSLEARGAEDADESDVLLSLLLSVWSPQPVRISAPATAIAPTAASRECAAVVRRVELAVMVGSSGGWVELPMGQAAADGFDGCRGSTRAHAFECRDLV